ncbi:anti-sigma factor antagonist [Leptospira ryugenii]|uniref:Anti-sigma factor antagonist n=1 Tax=Leptospira ryugenii TaxID=1917863 RepID=A0A2P2E313_9LEPT|nr:STAS domain-containing protein [Leptospira ryugenii]GBF51282.1 anti-sigma factor antagonist [Leptospira ryugenii]
MRTVEFSSLKIHIENTEISKEKVLLVSFDGQITNMNAYDINGKISGIFEESVYNIILDLSKLQYINSIGVATLLGMIKTVEQKNGKMYIGGLNHFLDNVIRLMELPKHIRIYPSRDAALANWV